MQASFRDRSVSRRGPSGGERQKSQSGLTDCRVLAATEAMMSSPERNGAVLTRTTVHRPFCLIDPTWTTDTLDPEKLDLDDPVQYERRQKLFDDAVNHPLDDPLSYLRLEIAAEKKAETERRLSGVIQDDQDEEVFVPPPLIRMDEWIPKARPWIIRDWIPGNCVCLLGGPAGGGKSRLAHQIAAELALGGGRQILGPDAPRFMTAKQCSTMYLSFETDFNESALIINRYPDEQKGLIWENLEVYNMMGGDYTLYKPGGTGHIDTLGSTTAAFDWMMKTAVTRSNGLIIIDTLSGCFSANENSRSIVRSFMSPLGQFANEYGIGVLVLSHPSKTSDFSGSTDWIASARSVLKLARRPPKSKKDDPADLPFQLTHEKSNVSKRQDTILLDIESYPFRAQNPDPVST